MACEQAYWNSERQVRPTLYSMSAGVCTRGGPPEGQGRCGLPANPPSILPFLGMREYFCDLHIHIGRTSEQRPVKITAARDLTFAGIARECVERKGIEVAGIVDCASPGVLRDIRAMLDSGEMVELPGGGLRYREALTVILGAELEAAEADGRGGHYVSYFPTVAALAEFSAMAAGLVTNLELSSQRCRVPAQSLWALVTAVGGVFVPAHAFTPHKSLYGNCARRLGEIFSPEAIRSIPALELGLSADSHLADRLAELADLTFLSNSDAHSLPKIAREYNVVAMAQPDYSELLLALRREGGRRVLANYGLDPRLGKYHRTACPDCGRIAGGEPPVLACTACGSTQVTRGVLDRLVAIADYPEPRHPDHRPPYHYQVPLQFLPGLGPVALSKLLNRFGTEMAVLHRAPEEDLVAVVGAKVAAGILAARHGRLALLPGGGGRYGRAVTNAAQTQMTLALGTP